MSGMKTTGKRLVEDIDRLNMEYLTKHMKPLVDTEHFTLIHVDANVITLLDKDTGITYTIAAQCPGPDYKHDPEAATLNVVIGERR